MNQQIWKTPFPPLVDTYRDLCVNVIDDWPISTLLFSQCPKTYYTRVGSNSAPSVQILHPDFEFAWVFRIFFLNGQSILDQYLTVKGIANFVVTLALPGLRFEVIVVKLFWAIFCMYHEIYIMDIHIHGPGRQGGYDFFFGKFHRVGISLYDQLDRVGIGITCHNLIPQKNQGGQKSFKSGKQWSLIMYGPFFKCKKQKRDKKLLLLWTVTL